MEQAVYDMGTITPIRSHVVRIALVDHERFDHLLLAMAADEAGLAADINLIADGDGLHDSLVEAEIDTLPDLVIIDRALRGRGALTLLDEIHSHPVTRQIPVVVFGTTGAWDAQNCRVRGASWVTAKPASFGGMVDFARTLEILALHARYRDIEAMAIDAFESLKVLLDLTGADPETVIDLTGKFD